MSPDTGALTTMKIINNFISNEEVEVLKKHIIDNEQRVKKMGPDTYNETATDSLTGRWIQHNFLQDKTVVSILGPKLHKLFPTYYITMWANIFRKAEYINPHTHGNATVSGNLYLDGPENSKPVYEGKDLPNEIGTLVYFPSTIVHWVDPNKSEIPRISMAFDCLNWNPWDDDAVPMFGTFIPTGDA